MRRWEKWIIRPETKFVRQHENIVRDDGDRLGTDRKKRRGKGLPAFRIHLSSVVKDGLRLHIQMFQPERRQAPSRAPVRIVKAISARFRRSMAVAAGMSAKTCLISSSVATGFSRRAVAIRMSCSDGLK